MEFFETYILTFIGLFIGVYLVNLVFNFFTKENNSKQLLQKSVDHTFDWFIFDEFFDHHNNHDHHHYDFTDDDSID
jgi:ABC-type antimicrobial peptide transport system permease subunit